MPLINNTMLQIEVGPLLFDTLAMMQRNSLFYLPRRLLAVQGFEFGLSFGLSLGKLACICFDWLLVRGISLPAVQLFVIAIESDLGKGVDNLTSC